MKSNQSIIDNLTGQLLIASPNLNDPNFIRTVTLICENNAMGSLGLIINKPAQSTIEDIFNELDIQTLDEFNSIPIMQGGPMGMERGFVIHNDGEYKHTSIINKQFNITTSKDILEDISTGNGPTDSLLILGYAGWGGGQLEEELKTNSWLCAPSDENILFKTPYQNRWEHAIHRLGINSNNMSDEIGHA
mgnify:FL=1